MLEDKIGETVYHTATGELLIGTLIGTSDDVSDIRLDDGTVQTVATVNVLLRKIEAEFRCDDMIDYWRRMLDRLEEI